MTRFMVKVGNDSLSGAKGYDGVYDPATGVDYLDGGSNNDYISAFGIRASSDAFVVTILGGTGNDTIYGSYRRDTISAGDGDDSVQSGDGMMTQ